MTVRVACAAVGRYVGRSAALLHALGDGVEVHYLHGPGLTRRARRRLEASADGAISFHAARDEGLPVVGDFTQAMWFRLQLPELVDADRVIYLDVDTLPLTGLGELFATDLGDSWLGAVTNIVLADHVAHVHGLGLDAGEYFNSGVLLLDLAALRREGAMDEVRAVARSRAGRPGWPDQDALNLVLGRNRHMLHPRWNAMNALWAFPERADEALGRQAAAEARADPAIRHFEGPGDNKPWARRPRMPHADAWRAHRRAAR
jgi:lipopolysaccharide biosynthesis glycosyltransferase